MAGFKKMEKYLSIVEEHSDQDINKKKLKQFLAETKVWEYARMSEQHYKDMSVFDCFELLKDYYDHKTTITNRHSYCKTY